MPEVIGTDIPYPNAPLGWDGESGKAADSNWSFDHDADGSAHQSNVGSLTFIIDGGGSEIADGQHGHLEILLDLGMMPE